MNLRALLPITLLALAVSQLTACDSDGGSPDETPDFTISADTAASTTLGTATDIHVKLRSTGFEGPVTLTVLGLPADWSAAIPASPVTLAADDSASATVTLTIPTNGTSAAAGQSFSIQATSGALQHAAATRLTVQDEYVIHLLLGAAAGPHWPAAAHGAHLNVGTTLTIQNDDTSSHIIHVDGSDIGVPHQIVGGAGTLPGQSFSNIVTGVGSGNFSCHSHDHGDTLSVLVSAPPAPGAGATSGRDRPH